MWVTGTATSLHTETQSASYPGTGTDFKEFLKDAQTGNLTVSAVKRTGKRKKRDRKTKVTRGKKL